MTLPDPLHEHCSAKFKEQIGLLLSIPLPEGDRPIIDVLPEKYTMAINTIRIITRNFGVLLVIVYRDDGYHVRECPPLGSAYPDKSVKIDEAIATIQRWYWIRAIELMTDAEVGRFTTNNQDFLQAIFAFRQSI